MESPQMQTVDGEPLETAKSKVYKKMGNMGKFVIIYNTNVKGMTPLPGTKVDADALSREVGASGLGFDVEVHENLKNADLLDKLDHYAKNVDHSNSTCFALAIFTHGDYEDVIYASDGIKYNLSQVLDKFCVRNCKGLEGKPKFFLLNMCRGEEKTVKTYEEGKTKVLTVPMEADFLIAHSTCPDHCAWVGTDTGSYYIAKFCEALKTNDFHDIHDIMTWVSGSTAQISAEEYAEYLQMPTFSSQLTAELHLREPSNRPPSENWSYRMQQAKRGLFYIFNDTRDNDITQLEEVARELNFTCNFFLKRTHSEMQDIATEYIKANHQDHDCFVCVIKTKSKNHDELLDGDKQLYRLKEFVQRFHGNECTGLQGKPKIFIIQAPYVRAPAGIKGRETKHIIPDTADTLIFYSTSPEPQPNSEGGTLFIHTLCEELRNMRSSRCDLHTAFSLVTQTMSGVVGLHVPTMTSQLRKKVVFN